ncbi:MAG: SDR family oxidoreductase [Rhodospirillaceae bacterium]|jgi:D-erythronate 2-dehydrogenase|nr:SDR family oxidoreductase [Rhodospirillaceae bacterium]MBT4688570.1 SDR family oxidoreductase [Rhodospirillaceae bacterium]MBT5080976.1 SDR family oxidoreductase [Rhodospirillaceae bacterium]MBT5527357.1 SDR family oxidoreductase [Rhodospirillaceae bacterium]MBT5878365.1 SDR family oxidoreductase [Rhodospirillaceae bacterium]
MKVVITGGGGFIGRKLAHKILERGELTGPSGQREAVTEVVLFDAVAPPDGEFTDERVRAVVGDITDAGLVASVIDGDTNSVFHLAAVVSAGAEADFDLGYQVNLDGTRNVFQAARAANGVPRVVFASSLAVYGGEVPDTVGDQTPITPETSYGAQKVMGEFLITDYSRKGYLDGRAMRLPTIVVRPGKPNKAASGFASGIVREPLNGVDMACPVTPESRMAIMSPRTVVECFMHMHELDAEKLGASRAILLSGFSVSMGDAAAAVNAVETNRARGKITFKVDPATQAIVDGWPKTTYSDKAGALGFPSDSNIEDVIAAYIEDELD